MTCNISCDLNSEDHIITRDFKKFSLKIEAIFTLFLQGDYKWEFILKRNLIAWYIIIQYHQELYILLFLSLGGVYFNWRLSKIIYSITFFKWGKY